MIKSCCAFTCGQVAADDRSLRVQYHGPRLAVKDFKIDDHVGLLAANPEATSYGAC